MSIVVKQRPSTSSTSKSHLFSPIPPCFRRTRSLSNDAPDPSTTSTSVYATDFGACVLTWTRTLLGRTLRIQLIQTQIVDFTIKIRSKPFLFWSNQGLKSFDGDVQILWDFRRCKFKSETEAESGFYLAVTIGGELALLIGDSSVKPIYSRLRVAERGGDGLALKRRKQRLVLRKEYVSGAAAVVGIGNGESKVRVSIEHFYSGRRDSGLRISFDGVCVLEVENLVWKFRGSEQVEYEGVRVNVSWDVYGWLFSNSSSGEKAKKDVTVEGSESGGSGVFVFDFEDAEDGYNNVNVNVWERMRRNEMSIWSSLSSISSSSSSVSVTDWWSAEEREMGYGGGFSLVVYATKT